MAVHLLNKPLHTLRISDTPNEWNHLDTSLAIATTLPIGVVTSSRDGWTYNFVISSKTPGYWAVCVSAGNGATPGGVYEITIVYIDR